MSHRTALLLAVAVAASASASVGPNWDKDLEEDAGASLLAAQAVTASTLTTITGKIAGALNDGPTDFQDVYRLVVSDPGSFLVDLTNAPGGGSATFDTCLYLFDEAGFARLANNDAAAGQTGSILRNLANDGSNYRLTEPGIYFLVVCGFPSQPVRDGEFVFNQAFLEAGIIATGSGNAPWALGWNQPGATGDYSIRVTGITGVPAPGAALPLLAAGLIGRRRRRE